jgi:hypothetical protein
MFFLTAPSHVAVSLVLFPLFYLFLAVVEAVCGRPTVVGAVHVVVNNTSASRRRERGGFEHPHLPLSPSPRIRRKITKNKR